MRHLDAALDWAFIFSSALLAIIIAMDSNPVVIRFFAVIGLLGVLANAVKDRLAASTRSGSEG